MTNTARTWGHISVRMSLLHNDRKTYYKFFVQNFAKAFYYIVAKAFVIQRLFYNKGAVQTKRFVTRKMSTKGSPTNF